MSVGLTKQLLTHLYTKRGLSDMEIASFIGVDRTAISHLRKGFDIPTRKSLGEIGEEYIEKKLKSFGCEVKNMNDVDKTSIFDLLVNNQIRIEVKTASEINGIYRFTLTNKEECNHVESNHRIRLPSGRTRKLYRKTCDYIICVCIKDKMVYPYIIPSRDITDSLQTILITPKRESKYHSYFKNWKQIKPDAPTSDR